MKKWTENGVPTHLDDVMLPPTVAQRQDTKLKYYWQAEKYYSLRVMCKSVGRIMATSMGWWFHNYSTSWDWSFGERICWRKLKISITLCKIPSTFLKFNWYLILDIGHSNKRCFINLTYRKNIVCCFLWVCCLVEHFIFSILFFVFVKLKEATLLTIIANSKYAWYLAAEKWLTKCEQHWEFL